MHTLPLKAPNPLYNDRFLIRGQALSAKVGFITREGSLASTGRG